MTTATEWAVALVRHALERGPDGRGQVVKRLAPSLGTVAFRTGDDDRPVPDVPTGPQVADPFGTGTPYAPCVTCGTYWPVGVATRTPFEWCHGTDDRALVRSEVARYCADTGTPAWVAERATEWADRYYLPEHLRPGCNACNV